MAKKEYFPFVSGAGRITTSAQWQRLASLWRPTGVIRDNYGDTSLQVSANGNGMVVYVDDGEALILGEYFRLWDGPEPLAIEAADATYDRIDLVVVRLDRVNETMDTAVVKGTPGATPAAPPPTQNSVLWEIPLAEVRVRAGTVSIASGDVTDRRSMAGVFAHADSHGENGDDPVTISPAQIWPQGAGSQLDADRLQGYVPVGSGGIVESGDNVNGAWVRYADGTQICWRRMFARAGGVTTWTYPQAFQNAPVVVVSGDSAYQLTLNGAAPTATSVGVRNGGAVDTYINVVAFGRWK